MTNHMIPDSKKKTNQVLIIILSVLGGFVLLCSLVAIIGFFLFWRSNSVPKTQVIIEPDYSIVKAPVNPSDIFAAVQVLNARCQYLKCGFSFTADENNQIIAQVPNSIDPQTILKQVLKVGLLELVDFGETPVTVGSTITTDLGMTDTSQSGGISWHTVMTGNAFKSANVSLNQFGNYQVDFTLNSEGTKILSDFSTNNVGHYLGIVLDKIVISVPVINNPIPDGKGVIQGSFTKEEADTLAMYLSMGALPIPLRVK
jgi:preprotein translocase subunit SecD